jgi:UDP-N-acetylmuramyl pentapeptide phosphotransferase/UDP-N-acetylglucosamine-1-phosphate transferase
MTVNLILHGVGLLLATLASWLVVGLLIRLAPRIGLVDRPNERSLHTRVTPRGGGIGFVVTLAAAAAWWLIADVNATRLQTEVAVFLGAALFIAAVSLRDDFVSLGAGVRFLCHIGAAGAAVGWIGTPAEIALPLIGTWTPGWLGPVLFIVWIVGLTNVYNFMDGIDGIAGAQGLVAGLAWTLAGIAWGLPAVTLLGSVLAGGCAGFLIHNWSPAKIFMGDVGSAFLGYCFGVLPLIAIRELNVAGETAVAAAIPILALLAVGPFVGDGFLTFLRRARRFEPVWKAHRSHLYQRLVRTGWSHAGVSVLYAGWCAVSAATGIYWLAEGPGAAWAVVGVPLISLGGMYLWVRRAEKKAGAHD